MTHSLRSRGSLVHACVRHASCRGILQDARRSDRSKGRGDHERRRTLRLGGSATSQPRALQGGRNPVGTCGEDREEVGGCLLVKIIFLWSGFSKRTIN